MNLKKVVIASDHAGFRLKESIKDALSGELVFTDLGTESEESVDYPDFAHALANAVAGGSFTCGILICGSGIGVSIAANRHQGVRAALCWQKVIAKLSRNHNDANVIVLPGRFIEVPEAVEAVRVFMREPFEGGRHQCRIDKI